MGDSDPNVGIELGQLAFIAAVLLVTAMLRRLPIAWPRAATEIPAYGIGSLASYWFCERLATLGA